LLLRFARMESPRRSLLLRAAVTVTAASFAVATLPFRHAMKLGPVPLGQGRRLDPADCVWAIEAAARRLPWRTMCIEKGLAAQRMLRQSGVDAVLHYGARHNDDEGKLEAHVWVTVGGKTIIGDQSPLQFTELATYQ
jgi:hypothetical protein